MSELTTPRRRRRRTDADRSVTAILRAAREILAEHPTASVEDVATAAGVSRQTVYAHFRTRDALISAVIDDVTREAVAEMDAAHLDEGPAEAALLRLLDAGWRSFRRYPRLMAATATMTTPDADQTRHHDVLALLTQVLTRGQQTGEFTQDLDATWLATAIVALGHTAGEAARTGQMPLPEAAETLATTALRLCRPEPR